MVDSQSQDVAVGRTPVEVEPEESVPADVVEVAVDVELTVVADLAVEFPAAFGMGFVEEAQDAEAAAYADIPTTVARVEDLGVRDGHVRNGDGRAIGVGDLVRVE